MYPLKKDQLDLHVIKSRCDQNQYDGKEGLRKLFDDLVQMCSNGKQFNDTNKGFQPWVLVDMMEKTVLDLQPLLLGVCSFTRAPSSSGFKSQMCSQRSRASQDTDPFDDAPDEVVATERGTMQSEFEMEEFTQEV